MNLDGIRINHAGLDQAAADLHTTVKQIDDRMNRLENELSALRSDWDGQAQSAYHVAKSKWDTAIQDMRNLLDETSRTVSQSNADYAAADKRGAAAFEI